MTSTYDHRGKGCGPRPHTWITGLDPIRHEMYIAWGRARAQAAFRNELWELKFEQWESVWGDNWHLRGRTRGCLQLVRKNSLKPWKKTNVMLMDRNEFRQQQDYIVRSATARAQVEKRKKNK